MYEDEFKERKKVFKSYFRSSLDEVLICVGIDA